MNHMTMSIRRIWAMLLRYLFLHKRSLPRTLELVFWPVMELFVWGFVAVYVQTIAPQNHAGNIMFLLNAIIFWDILYRSQQGVTISFMEEIWTQNMLNLLVSPLRIWEWLTATFLYGLLKTGIITAILALIAYICYSFNLIGEVGFKLIPLAANLLLFGWILGIITSALLIRWGHAAEALIWGVPFLIQPFSAIYYPLSILPGWLRFFSKCLPSTYIFEGMRLTLSTHIWPVHELLAAFGINLLYFLLACLYFSWLFERARLSGRLVRLGMD